MHRCPAPGCQVKVADTLFACRTHWYQISAPTRRAIFATAGLPLTHDQRWPIVQDAMDELRAKAITA